MSPTTSEINPLDGDFCNTFTPPPQKITILYFNLVNHKFREIVCCNLQVEPQSHTSIHFTVTGKTVETIHTPCSKFLVDFVQTILHLCSVYLLVCLFLLACHASFFPLRLLLLHFEVFIVLISNQYSFFLIHSFSSRISS
jgi:hypothetical protein